MSNAEISKRVDFVEGTILTLSTRLYENDKTQGKVVVSVEKVTDQLTVIFQKLKSNDEKIKDLEEVISPIKLVKSHWKLIVWLFFACSSLGFAFDGGIKNIVHFVDKYKVSSTTQNIMRNERNG